MNLRRAALQLMGYTVLLGLTPCLAHSHGVPPPAYSLAAQRSGVPSNILFAVALQESGVALRGKRLPWPWTLNIAGHGHYFPSHGQACLALQSALMRVSAMRIDAGLAQINLGHQRRFYSHPCELLRPHKNLDVAATLLREHHRAGENWLMAAGRFHRPAGGPIAARYRRNVRQHLTELERTQGRR